MFNYTYIIRIVFKIHILKNKIIQKNTYLFISINKWQINIVFILSKNLMK